MVPKKLFNFFHYVHVYHNGILHLRQFLQNPPPKLSCSFGCYVLPQNYIIHHLAFPIPHSHFTFLPLAISNTLSSLKCACFITCLMGSQISLLYLSSSKLLSFRQLTSPYYSFISYQSHVLT